MCKCFLSSRCSALRPCHMAGRTMKAPRVKANIIMAKLVLFSIFVASSVNVVMRPSCERYTGTVSAQLHETALVRKQKHYSHDTEEDEQSFSVIVFIHLLENIYAHKHPYYHDRNKLEERYDYFPGYISDYCMKKE